MTLYELIEKANSVLTPNSKEFYNYVIWTSDDNWGFLRTCYRKKSKPLEDKRLGDVSHILISFQEEFDKTFLTTRFEHPFGELTKTKLQFFYDIMDIEYLEDEKQWSERVGFNHFIEIQL